MKVLITGAAGFIGSALALRLLERGDSVVGIDNHNDYYDPALKEARLARHANHPGYSHLRIDLAEIDPAVLLPLVQAVRQLRDTLAAKAEAYKAGVEALGSQGYAALQIMQAIGERNVRIVPDVAVSGGGAGGNGLADALLALMVRQETRK